jgi:hypothetical protein
VPDDLRDLYEHDFLLWSKQQADRLRALRHRLRENREGVDWDHVIEEIADLGRSELNAVASNLVEALVHLLKATGWPQARDARNWVRDAGTFLRNARLRWTPGMDQRLDVVALYAMALEAVRAEVFDEGPPGPLPERCPVTLRDLIPKEKGVAAQPAALLERFRAG